MVSLIADGVEFEWYSNSRSKADRKWPHPFGHKETTTTALEDFLARKKIPFNENADKIELWNLLVRHNLLDLETAIPGRAPPWRGTKERDGDDFSSTRRLWRL